MTKARMLTVEEALAAILEEVQLFAPNEVNLSAAHGLVLAEDIVADVDSPPFDKALMDGFAVRSADIVDGRTTLDVLETVMAGTVPQVPVGSGQATQIMTGAPIPAGADAVVKIEDVEILEGQNHCRTVKIETRDVQPGENRLAQGASVRTGETIIPSGRQLRPQDLGAMAEMGRHRVSVYPRPRVAVLATGDELVTIDQKPAAGQIRNSNETMLVAQIERAGGVAVPLGIARDERNHLREKILAGLACDMLLLSGGVSAGKLDLVPAELEAAGVRQVFHKVNVKPGKPVWFGVLDRESETADSSLPDKATVNPSRCYVFGLPGNPVSSMVCHELFARTAVCRLMNLQPAGPRIVPARLTKEHRARGDRPTYFPASMEWTDSGAVVTPVNWQGSADLRATVDADAMVHFPAGDHQYSAGDTVDVIEW